MGYFSELRQAFKNFADISATQASLINELNDLKKLNSLSAAQQQRYNQLLDLLSNTIVSSNDINNIQRAIENIETFLDNQPLYYRGVYSATTSYQNCDVVYFLGDAYVCIKPTPLGTSPLKADGLINDVYWRIFVRKGAAAQFRPYKNSVAISVNTNEIAIGINTFDKAKDCLMVFMNGLYLHEDSDYIINTTGTAITKKSGNWLAANDYSITFDFVVWKNEYSFEEAEDILVRIDCGNSLRGG